MKYTEITIELIKNLLPKRIQESNKGTYGKVLNIAGCNDYQGAAYLSTLAPLKVGAGLVTLATISNVIKNLAGNTPWATFYQLPDYKGQCISNNAFKKLKNIIDNYDTISIGAGLSNNNKTQKFVYDFVNYFKTKNTKIVIDADAINVLAKTDIEQLPQNTIITPHPLELSRLINIPLENIQANRIEYAKYTAQKYKCVVVLKGNKTIISTPYSEIFINSSGNSSLAKAGSGDVLTGIISGFLAQGLTIQNAAILGVYIHGLCGELASQDLTEYSVLATDQINYIPKVIKKILEE